MYQDQIILTPQDILEKEFKVDARGYRAQEVDKFLDMVIKDYAAYNQIIQTLSKEKEALIEENDALRSEARQLKELNSMYASDAQSTKNVSQIDLLKRLSQLEKTVYGDSKNN